MLQENLGQRSQRKNKGLQIAHMLPKVIPIIVFIILNTFRGDHIEILFNDIAKTANECQ
jgi:hypothetical protein